MNNMKQNFRLGNIDALRGICVLLVLFTHLAIAPWLAGRVGVAAFFLVSGYVIPFSLQSTTGQHSIIDFWLKRFFRLWPAYWLSIFLAILIGTKEVAKMSFSDILINFTMLQGFVGKLNVIPVYWTLQVELCFYFIITILLFFLKSRDEKYCRTLSVFFALLALAMGLLRYYVGIKLPVAIPIAMALMFLSALARIRRLNGHALPYGLACLILVLFVPTCIFGYADAIEPDQKSVHYIAAYTISIVLFFVFEKLRDMPKHLVFLGTISYSFYLMHELVIFMVDSYAPDLNIALRICVVFALTVGISVICFYLVEKPAQSFGNNLLKKIRSRRVNVSERISSLKS